MSLTDIVKNAGNKIGKGLAIGGAVVASWMPLSANADGALEIFNKVGGFGGSLDLIQYNDSSINDGFDSWDTPWLSPPSGNSSLYSDIGGTPSSQDYHLPTSDTPYNIGLVYNGNLSTPTSNYLALDMPYGAGWLFENKDNITLREINSFGDFLGAEWDIRDIIANQSGVIDLGSLSPGSYSVGTPYKYLQLDFEPLSSSDGTAPEPSTGGLVGALIAARVLTQKRRTLDGTNPRRR